MQGKDFVSDFQLMKYISNRGLQHRYLISMLLFLPLLAHAEPREIELATASFPPFRQISGNTLGGADYDIVTAVLSRMGYQYTIRPFPLQRALKTAAAAQGPVGFFTFTKNAERERQFVFSAPISTVRDVFFKRSQDTISWGSYADLQRYTVGVSEGYNYAPDFMRALQQNQFKVMMATGDTPENEQLRRLQRGLIDLAICEISVCSALISRNKAEFGKLDYIDKSVGNIRTFHLGISRNYPQAASFIKAFDKELAQFAAEGKRREIFRRYGMAVALD